MAKAIVFITKFLARWMPSWMKQFLYQLGPLSNVIRKSLNNALPKGIHLVAISGGILQGYSMHLDLQREKDFWMGTYEIPLLSAIKEIGEAGIVAYDLGANIGYISLALAEILGPQSQIFAFEALPENIERLQKNISANQMKNQIAVVQKAVDHSTGTSTFLVHSSGGMGKLSASKGRDEQYQTKLEIPTIALDDFVFKEANPPPKLIKMDIEGAEGRALAGMQRLLKEHRPSLLIELHGPEASQLAWKELSKAQYQIRSLGQKERIISNVDELDWKSYVLAEAIP